VRMRMHLVRRVVVTLIAASGLTLGMTGVSEAIIIEKLPQVVTFTTSPPSSATVGGPTYAVAATASSGKNVTFSSETPSVCSVVGSSVNHATVSFIGAGTCTIVAKQAGDIKYEPEAETQSFVVGKGSQVIAFTTTAPSSATVGGAAYTVTATGGGSGNPVTIAIDAASSSVCSIAGSTVSFIGAGTCTIDANQAGTANYNGAPQAQQSFAVGKNPQTITFASTSPSSATVGGPTYAVSATATSGLPVTVAIDAASSSVCSIAGSTVSFIAVGTCTIDANQAGNAIYNAAPQAQQSFAVGSAPTLTPPSTPPSTPTPIPTPTSTLTPTSNFSLLGNPAVNPKTGAVTFKASVGDPGTFRWLLTFQNGKFGAFQARNCRAAQVKLKGRCRPAQIVFGKGGMAVVAAGIVSFTVTPSASARAALKNALKKTRGLLVTAILTFQSSRGGTPISHTQSITVALKKGKK
jgi:hypothetical protein